MFGETCSSIHEAIRAYNENKETMRRRFDAMTSTTNALFTLEMTAVTDEQKSLVESLKQSFADSEKELQEFTLAFRASENSLEARRTQVKNDRTPY